MFQEPSASAATKVIEFPFCLKVALDPNFLIQVFRFFDPENA